MAKKTKQPVVVPSVEELQTQVEAIDTARQEALDSIVPEFTRLFTNYFDRVRSVVAQNEALQQADALDLQTATVIMNDLHQMLVDAGLESVVKGFAHEFPALAQAAVAYYEPFGLDASLAGVAKQTLAAWVDYSSNELLKTFDASLVAPVRSALLQVNFGNQTRDDLIKQITTIEPTVSVNDARVLVDQAFSSFQRAIVVQKGDAVGLEIYQYLGPDDLITSPQCHAMLNVNLHGAPGILYKDEITPHLHANLERYGINPLIEGGHPNCRHQWSPVTLEYAQKLGFVASKSRGANAEA